MIPRVLAFVALVFSFWSGAASAQTVPFARDAIVIESSLGNHGGLLILVMLRESKGKIAVCGASWFTRPNGTVRSMRREALGNLLLQLNGEGLQADPRAFASYDTEDQAVKGGAKCQATRTAWDPSYTAAKLKFRPRSDTLRSF